MSESTKAEVKHWTKRDTAKVLIGGLGGVLGLFGIGRVASKVSGAIENAQEQNELDKQKEILEHKAKVLETDNTLGVEKAVAQIQVECKGTKLSTFVFTELDESKFPKVFTEYEGKTVELLKFRSTGRVDWYIPGEDVPEGEVGIKGAIGAEYVFAHQDKFEGNDSQMISYWPPMDGKAQSIKFDNQNERGFWFNVSELPDKVQGLLFGELR